MSQLFKDRFDYVRQTFVHETPAMRRTRAALVDPNDQISLNPEDGALLALWLRLAGVRRGVEIGTLGGYAAQWIVSALPADGRLITIEKDPRRAALARDHLAHLPQVELREGAALDVLPHLSGPFDFVFIDADKINYDRYLDWAEDGVRAGGLIIADNTLLFDAVWSDAPTARVRPTALAAMRRFNQRLADPARYDSVMLPTPAGFTIARKKDSHLP
jgi:predicted O-methyltransferase YrrM